MNIAFCGLGLMGTEMVLRLLAAGHQVAVWNRTPEKCRRLVQAGARQANTPAEATAGNEIVMLCLLDKAAVEQVVFGSTGIASVAAMPRVVVDHSSISPEATRDFALRLATKHGPDWVDAPVSGGVAGAKAGTLTVMAGGSAPAIELTAPPIRAFASRLTHVGSVGAGQVMKLCNQTIVAAMILAIGEAVALAHNSGLDPAVLTSALAGGWADSKPLQIFVPRMTALPQDKIGAISTLLKDVESIAQQATDTDTAMPVSAAVRETMRAAVARGLGDADLSAVVQLSRR